MGKEIAIVDSSGTIAVSKKRVISTGAQTFTEDGLLIPKHTFVDVKKEINSKYRKHNILVMCGIYAGAMSALGSMVTVGLGGDPTLLVAIPVGAIFMGLSITSLDQEEKTLTKVKKAHALQLDKWLNKRYGINVNWATASGELFGEIVMNSMTKGHTLTFTATNGNDYILNQTTEGALFVQPVVYNLPTPEQVRKIEASTNIFEANGPQIEVLDESIKNLLDSVKTDVNALRTYDLDAEQEHAVNRAMDEANRAVSTFMKIQKLKPDANNMDTVDVLSLVAQELSGIKNTIVESLQMDLRSVNSHRA